MGIPHGKGVKMRYLLFASSLAVLLLLSLYETDGAPANTLFPIPSDIQVMTNTSPQGPLTLSPSFRFDGDTGGCRSDLARAMARYEEIIFPGGRPTEAKASTAGAAKNVLHKVEVVVSSFDTKLDHDTDYSYSLNITYSPTGESTAEITAQSIYGAMYGMETFTQLITADNEVLFDTVSLHDSPHHNHRGIMIDTGRRFVPVTLLENIMDGMSYSKLNVLHLHLSDFAAVRIESLKYPALTASLGPSFYSHDDIRGIVSYAQQRGIRVVPEIDVPGHSSGFRPLAKDGMQFCSSSKFQLYDDKEQRTRTILYDLLVEWSPLFPDQLFHLGCDETNTEGPCDASNIKQLELFLQHRLQDDLGKTPVGWNELLTVSDAADSRSTIQVWARASSANITQHGFRVIESHDPEFYLDQPCDPATGGNCYWLDISQGVDDTKLLGGETAMWGDEYCEPPMCPHSGEVGWMYDRKYDAVFAESFSSMIWPRAAAAAGAYWNFQSLPHEQFQSLYASVNNRLRARGVSTCPTGCTCSQKDKCDSPYSQGVTVAVVATNSH